MEKRDTAETLLRSWSFADRASERIGHPIHSRWYSAPFWARVAWLVEGDDKDVARLALVRAARKRAKEAAA